jgi:tRNA(Arg) A34 adenosine deaminase TadA
MTKKRFSISAIIYDKRGNVLSIGNNSYVKTHPLQAEYARRAGEPHKVYLHAEISAIVRCRSLDKAHKIVIFRYMEDGSPAEARPCRICQEAIKVAGIKYVEHT